MTVHVLELQINVDDRRRTGCGIFLDHGLSEAGHPHLSAARRTDLVTCKRCIKSGEYGSLQRIEAYRVRGNQPPYALDGHWGIYKQPDEYGVWSEEQKRL